MDNKVCVRNVKSEAYRILIGVCISFIMTGILLFIYACLLVNTNIGENTIKPIVLIITALSILVGSFFSSIRIKKKGILNGMLVGTCYSLIIYFLSSMLLAGFRLEFYSMIFIVLSIIIGAIGGIIGVNIG